MRTLRSLTLCATFVGSVVATAASAAPIVVDTVSNAPLAGMTYTSFDGRTMGSTSQTTNTGINVALNGGAAFVQGTVTGSYVAPTMSTGADTTAYVSTGTGTATLNFATPTSYFGLLWGSIDAGNFLTFLSADGTSTRLTASQVFGSAFNLSGASTQYVNFTSASPFTSIVLSSTTPSFEFDNVATMAQAGAVPELASWAMMIIGMGAVGYAMRRQKAAVRVSYAG